MLITACINAALSQAKLQHPHTCDILEIQFTVQGNNCEVYHILEAMDTSVGIDIEAGKRYTETELRDFLQQTASALAYAHHQNIAHRDIKPDNVFRTGNTYKVGDFDCVFSKRDSTYTKSYAGDTRYMSPQLRDACTRGTPYHSFKADVFALAASLLHMATRTNPEVLLISDRLDEAVGRQVGTLPCSQLLQTLLRSMLDHEETHRPSIQQVLSALAQMPTLPHLFAAVSDDKVQLYNLATQQCTQHTLSVNFGWGGSYIQVDTHTLLCIGGGKDCPGCTAVYSLDLSSLTLTSLPPLRTARHGAGVAKAAHTVFVFGGFDLKSCEKYVQDWLPLGDMREVRYGYTPCTFRTLIYLPCPNTTPTIETFSPQTETFTVLPISLPPNMKIAYASVSFVANGELCVLTYGKQIVRWRIESKRMFGLLYEKFGLFDTDRECWSTQPPLIVDSLVLIANGWNGKVEKFSLESYAFI